VNLSVSRRGQVVRPSCSCISTSMACRLIPIPRGRTSSRMVMTLCAEVEFRTCVLGFWFERIGRAHSEIWLFVRPPLSPSWRDLPMSSSHHSHFDRISNGTEPGKDKVDTLSTVTVPCPRGVPQQLRRVSRSTRFRVQMAEGLFARIEGVGPLKTSPRCFFYLGEEGVLRVSCMSGLVFC
jgi:hypothetical protein